MRWDGMSMRRVRYHSGLLNAMNAMNAMSMPCFE